MEIPEISLAPEEIFSIGSLQITNTFALTLFLSLLVGLLLIFVFSRAKVIPGKLQNFWEMLLETLYNFYDSVTEDREKTNEIFPLAATLFLLILSANLIELIPGLGVFSILRSPSSDLNFTFALSLFSVFSINFLAIRRLGLWGHFKKFLNFRSPIFFFVGILDGIGEVARILSLAFRLFGNLFAGEVLLMVTSAMFAFLLPLPFLALEIMVAFIQAFIFSSLVVIFYASALKLEHEE